MKNKFKIKILIISIIIFILSGTVVYAAILIDSAYITYDNTSSGLSSDNVKSALDELDSSMKHSENLCTSAFNCTSTAVPKCKRVTESSNLHTETCLSYNNYCQRVEGKGNTITYGRAKELGTPLEPGDAFDCKVSTSGGYTERFYYVSDYYDTTAKYYNSDVAVLIYDSNTFEGINDDGYGFSNYDDNNTNYNGPVTAATHLPTTSSWNNISLYKTNRQILNEQNSTSTSGGTLPTAFSYSGKAARLLTFQEVNAGGCIKEGHYTDSKSLRYCNFLFEKTYYTTNSGFRVEKLWLETGVFNSNTAAYTLSYVLVGPSASQVKTTRAGVRPVIEIPKSEISY